MKDWITELYIKEQIQRKRMEARINIVEASARFAESKVKEIFTNNNKEKTEEEIENLIYTKDEENDTMIYTDSAQEKFNNWYDYFFDVLLNCKV